MAAKGDLNAALSTNKEGENDSAAAEHMWRCRARSPCLGCQMSVQTAISWVIGCFVLREEHIHYLRFNIVLNSSIKLDILSRMTFACVDALQSSVRPACLMTDCKWK